MSQEYDIDCRMDELLAKLVRGTLTDHDRAEMEVLQRRRVRLMTPDFRRYKQRHSGD